MAERVTQGRGPLVVLGELGPHGGDRVIEPDEPRVDQLAGQCRDDRLAYRAEVDEGIATPWARTPLVRPPAAELGGDPSAHVHGDGAADLASFREVEGELSRYRGETFITRPGDRGRHARSMSAEGCSRRCCSVRYRSSACDLVAPATGPASDWRGTVDLHFATAWEMVADTVPDNDAIVQGTRRLSYRDFDDTAARFAAALEAAGVAEGGSVGLYLYNCPEYLLAQHGAFKHRAVPVNVNYRYLDDELTYLLDNSDAQAVVFHSSLGDRVANVRDRLSKVKLLVEVADDDSHLDGAVRFDDLVGAHTPQSRKERSGEDLYMLYTGGTTGLPKGVMYRHGDLVDRLYTAYTVMGLSTPAPLDAGQIAPLVIEATSVTPVVTIPCCPLMHGTGMWVAAMRALLLGGAVVLLEERSFDPHEVWTLTEREGVNEIVIVGDAFARPMLRALERRETEGRPYEISSLQRIASSGAIWSAEIKDGLRARMSAQFIDLLGSTEGGTFGLSAGSDQLRPETARFSPAPGTKVITEDRRVVEAGSGERGMLASMTSAFGYYKDPEKTERTFLHLDGQSYVLTGDWATVESDGTIALLGRGSNCINSGGEKVFVEEVEEAIKRHPDVDDCLVVGLADERFGQRVAAVVGSSSSSPPTGEELREWLRPTLAHYKIPKVVTVLERVRRAPNGKADYGWAKETSLAHGVDL